MPESGEGAPAPTQPEQVAPKSDVRDRLRGFLDKGNQAQQHIRQPEPAHVLTEQEKGAMGNARQELAGIAARSGPTESITPKPEMSAEDQVDLVTKRFQAVLASYMQRPNSDLAVLSLMNEVVSKLDTALTFGDSDEQLANERLLDVKAALIGARMVLTPDRERIQPEVEPVRNTGLARRFLELSGSRIGSYDAASGVSEVRMRIDPNQAVPTVKSIRNS